MPKTCQLKLAVFAADLKDVDNGDEKMIGVDDDAHKKDARRGNAAEYFASEKVYIQNDSEVENATPTPKLSTQNASRNRRRTCPMKVSAAH